MQKEKTLKHIWLPYTQMKNVDMPPEVVKTKGSYIYLADGRKLIDGISSWWSVCHGYNHPHIIKSMQKQLKKFPHVMLAGLANEPAYHLADRLARFVNKGQKQILNKVFFSDSGSTAVEVAMKIAVQFFLNQGNDKKSKIISFQNSYHGDTMGGMSLCDPKSGMHAKFKNYLPKQLVTSIPQNNKELKQYEEFLKKHKEKAAAIILEPLIQCAGGMKFHTPEILEKIIRLAQKHNILVIADECATGFYRTGSKFAFHQTNSSPDILVIGKALTGGTVTLAATITSDKIFEAFLDDELDKALMHGPTFMGNPLACSAANASLDLFEKFDYAKKSKTIAKIFVQELQKFKAHTNVKEIRILGATAVIELKNLSWAETLDLRKLLLNEQVWLRPFSNVIYFMPPLTIKESEIKKLVAAVGKSLQL